jgi:hypothetical protein
MVGTPTVSIVAKEFELKRIAVAAKKQKVNITATLGSLSKSEISITSVYPKFFYSLFSSLVVS